MGWCGWGVQASVRVWVRAVSLRLASLRFGCCGLRGVVLVVVLLLVVCSLGRGLRFGVGLWVGSGSRLRRTSVRRCEGAGAGWGVFPVCCRGARVASKKKSLPCLSWRA